MMSRAVDQSGVDCVNLSVASAKTKVCGFSNQYDMVPREPPAYIGLAPIETTSRNVEGDFTMSTKINTAVVAFYRKLVPRAHPISAHFCFGDSPAPLKIPDGECCRSAPCYVHPDRQLLPGSPRRPVSP